MELTIHKEFIINEKFLKQYVGLYAEWSGTHLWKTHESSDSIRSTLASRLHNRYAECSAR